jgi:hypothetical protein
MKPRLAACLVSDIRGHEAGMHKTLLEPINFSNRFMHLGALSGLVPFLSAFELAGESGVLKRFLCFRTVEFMAQDLNQAC